MKREHPPLPARLVQQHQGDRAEERHVDLDEAAREHVGQHVAVGAPVARDHLSHQPPDDDREDGDEQHHPAQPRVGEVAGGGQRGAHRELRPQVDLAPAGAQRQRELPDRKQHDRQADDHERPLHQQQGRDDHRPDQHADEDREHEVATRALLDPLVRLVDLIAGVRDVRLDLRLLRLPLRVQDVAAARSGSGVAAGSGGLSAVRGGRGGRWGIREASSSPDGLLMRSLRPRAVRLLCASAPRRSGRRAGA